MKLWRREWLLACRGWADIVNPLAFFVIISCLFPMAIDVATEQLQRLASGVIWMALLLSIIIDLPRMFQEDYQDGSLEQWLLSGQPLVGIILYRIALRWLFIVGPMIILCPLIGALYGLSWLENAKLLLSVMLATPTILLLGGLISALLLNARQASVLLAILLLPLLVPVLIFAVSLTQTLNLLGACALLLALLFLSLSLVPLTISGILRQMVV